LAPPRAVARNAQSIELLRACSERPPSHTAEHRYELAPPIEIVSQDVSRVLLNLSSNGIYAVTRRSREVDGAFRPELRIATREFGEGVEIRVRDNGVGIPPEPRSTCDRAPRPQTLLGYFLPPLYAICFFYSSQLLMHRPTRCRVELWPSLRTVHARFTKLAPLVPGNRDGLEPCASA